jgi:hypothetical protein
MIAEGFQEVAGRGLENAIPRLDIYIYLYPLASYIENMFLMME